MSTDEVYARWQKVLNDAVKDDPLGVVITKITLVGGVTGKIERGFEITFQTFPIISSVSP
jgi:hypothetical protein